MDTEDSITGPALLIDNNRFVKRGKNGLLNSDLCLEYMHAMNNDYI